MNHDDPDDDLFQDEDEDQDEEPTSDAPPEPLKFEKFQQICPACKQPVTDQMDSCPYCGDLLFRHLKDGMFAPRKGPLVKLFAVIVVLLVVLGTLAMLLSIFL